MRRVAADQRSPASVRYRPNAAVICAQNAGTVFDAYADRYSCADRPSGVSLHRGEGAIGGVVRVGGEDLVPPGRHRFRVGDALVLGDQRIEVQADPARDRVAAGASLMCRG
jgi:hypothetical protein